MTNYEKVRRKSVHGLMRECGLDEFDLAVLLSLGHEKCKCCMHEYLDDGCMHEEGCVAPIVEWLHKWENDKP